MSMTKYLLNTTWNQKLTDWRQYRALCKEVSALDKERAKCFDKIKVEVGILCPDVERTVIKNVSGCMRSYVLWDEPYSVGLASRPGIYTERIDVCEAVLSNDLKSPCLDRACPYNADNRAYFTACNEYRAAKNDKKRFWSKRFENYR